LVFDWCFEISDSVCNGLKNYHNLLYKYITLKKKICNYDKMNHEMFLEPQINMIKAFIH